MYGYGYYGWGMDPTILLLVIGMLLSLAASAKLRSTFAVYKKVRSHSGITGAEAAQRILRAAGITDVQVVPIRGSLTDHYDPRTKTVSLSEDIYGRNSLAAVGVAAHECGHAIQDAINYAPLNIRSAIVPAANIGSQLSWPLFIAGLIFSIDPLVTLGIVLFSLAVLFQLVTLPVEINASSRALKMLESTGILGADEKKGARKVLTAAALTISILEAMGNGMFIITTDHAGIPDIVEDGVNGIVIFNEQNKKMIYKEMLYVSVTDLKAICNNNRIICQSHFSEKNYLGKMKEIYNKW